MHAAPDLTGGHTRTRADVFSGPVTVAADNTAGGRAALRWALLEAMRVDAPLRVVYVHDESGLPDQRLEQDAEGRFDLARARVAKWVTDVMADTGADLDVSIEVIRGHLTAELARAGRGARLVVLGAATCASHAYLAADLEERCDCPIAIVKEMGPGSIQSATRSGATSLEER